MNTSLADWALPSMTRAAVAIALSLLLALGSAPATAGKDDKQKAAEKAAKRPAHSPPTPSTRGAAVSAPAAVMRRALPEADQFRLATERHRQAVAEVGNAEGNLQLIRQRRAAASTTQTADALENEALGRLAAANAGLAAARIQLAGAEQNFQTALGNIFAVVPTPVGVKTPRQYDSLANVVLLPETPTPAAQAQTSSASTPQYGAVVRRSAPGLPAPAANAGNEYEDTLAVLDPARRPPPISPRPAVTAATRAQAATTPDNTASTSTASTAVSTGPGTAPPVPSQDAKRRVAVAATTASPPAVATRVQPRLASAPSVASAAVAPGQALQLAQTAAAPPGANQRVVAAPTGAQLLRDVRAGLKSTPSPDKTPPKP
ncbi:MAG: hypothetical protein ACT4PZ_11895 [Panacagrimonas sp.]